MVPIETKLRLLGPFVFVCTTLMRRRVNQNPSSINEWKIKHYHLFIYPLTPIKIDTGVTIHVIDHYRYLIYLLTYLVHVFNL